MVVLSLPISFLGQATEMKHYILSTAFVAMSLVGHQTAAQTESVTDWGTIQQVSTHIGGMTSTLDDPFFGVDGTVGFEPYQAADDMFSRGDLVYLMRHGPTDWSKRDENGVASTDCENQRVMTELGKLQMTTFATTLASNGVFPSQIVVSEWCRNQQTLEAMLDGFSGVDAERVSDIPIETDEDVNLLLSLNGAPNVDSLSERISSWDGDPDRAGPLLIISHYTNIEELTQFRVLEGEILVIDPDLDNRVLGYIRLDSAAPDEGHFADTLDSPLLADSDSLRMVERYYEAVGKNDLNALDEIIADGWVSRGINGPSNTDVDGFLSSVDEISNGLSGGQFNLEETYIADNVVTVIGSVTGTHTGEIFGIAATGNEVEFQSIAVHIIEDSVIQESWQMVDRISLIQQISGQ